MEVLLTSAAFDVTPTDVKRHAVRIIQEATRVDLLPLPAHRNRWPPICPADSNGLSQLMVVVSKKMPPGAICATERTSVNISCVYTSANGASS